jgi:hypothetical protein
LPTPDRFREDYDPEPADRPSLADLLDNEPDDIPPRLQRLLTEPTVFDRYEENEV